MIDKIGKGQYMEEELSNDSSFYNSDTDPAVKKMDKEKRKSAFPTSTLGELCKIEKGETGIASATPGKYPLVNTSADRKSCSSYQFNTAAVCIPLVSSTGHGKKTLNYVHYQEGKFALGTILAAVIPRNPKVLSAAYLHRYLQFFKDKKIVPLMKGAANVSLAIKDIAGIKITVPPMREQISFVELFNKINISCRDLQDEFSNQSSYISSLRQAILQEAIEGKLTEKWRKQNPDLISGENHASKWLEKIRSKKEQMIKENKIKKEKPQPPISENEIPFNLPKGWVWCRVGGISLHSLGKMLDRSKNKGTHQKYLRNLNVRWFDFDLSDLLEMRFQTNEYEKCTARKGDLLICEGGYPGRAAIWNSDYAIYYQKAIHRVRFLEEEINKFFLYFLYLSKMTGYLDKYLTGSGIKHFTGQELHRFVLPLPSLLELRIIIKKIDSFLAAVNQLEKQTTEMKECSQLFMRSVMREAFER
ncbi:MAG: restriction endonuclease subunit S [Candidatus Wallbacteria bacterium]|nr:restriction endonuclease subunit S [Candidatus Wallbacteria bacterium]